MAELARPKICLGIEITKRVKMAITAHFPLPAGRNVPEEQNALAYCTLGTIRINITFGVKSLSFIILA